MAFEALPKPMRRAAAVGLAVVALAVAALLAVAPLVRLAAWRTRWRPPPISSPSGSGWQRRRGVALRRRAASR